MGVSFCPKNTEMGQLFFARRAILTTGRAKTASNEKIKSVDFYLDSIIFLFLGLVFYLWRIWPNIFKICGLLKKFERRGSWKIPRSSHLYLFHLGR